MTTPFGRMSAIAQGRRPTSHSHPRRSSSRPARVAITLALAHKIQQAIDCGVVRDCAEVARRLGLTRARLTQVMDLTLLAPDIQERILFAEAEDGVEPATERRLREVVRRDTWADQRMAFAQLSHAPTCIPDCNPRRLSLIIVS